MTAPACTCWYRQQQDQPTHKAPRASDIVSNIGGSKEAPWEAAAPVEPTAAAPGLMHCQLGGMSCQSRGKTWPEFHSSYVREASRCTETDRGVRLWGITFMRG